MGSNKGKKYIWGTVIYPSAIQYFKENIISLQCQTNKDFFILIINEVIDSNEIKKMMACVENAYYIVEAKNKDNPVLNRIQLLNDAIKFGGDLLIIGDCDDLFSSDRAGKIIDAYNRYSDASFFYNKIVYIDGSDAMPKLPEKTDSLYDVAQYNYLGMSNTAINLKKLDDNFLNSLNECCSNIFDWYLYSRIILNSGYGIKINDACTKYRIYGGNIAGVRSFSRENLLYEYTIKKKHYEMLAKYDMLFEDLLKKISNLDIDELYINYNNAEYEKNRHYWWDLIQVEVAK